MQVVEKPQQWSDNTISVNNPNSQSNPTDITIAADDLPAGSTVVVNVDDPDVFDRWGDNGGAVAGGEVIPGQTAIRIPVQADGRAAATIERIPLQPDEETAITVDVVLPGGNQLLEWTVPWMQGEGEPTVHITQWVGGEVVGGNTLRPPRPLRLFLPLIGR